MSEQAVVVLGANIGNFQSAMSTIQSSMNETGAKIQSAMGDAENATSDGASGIKSALSGIGAAIAGAFAVDAIIDFGKTMIETAADSQALQSQYEQVMGKMKGDTDKYLDEMSKKWNKHPSELKSAYTGYVAILKSKGMSEKDAHDTAEKYLSMTVDANAFANEDMADTTARFMGGIKGEYDSLDTAMVNLSATMMNDKAQEEYGKKFDELTVAQQETLKTQEMLRQHTSAGVFGQGGKEADSYANNLAMVKNKWADVLTIMGSPLLVIANEKLKEFAGFLDTVSTDGISTALKNIIPPEFQGGIDIAKGILEDFKLALGTTDWGLAGVGIGTALGTAITNIQGLGQKIVDKLTTEFNAIDWEGFVTNIGEGASALGISLVTMLNTDIAEAMQNGDWGEVGTLLAEALIDAIGKVAEKSSEFATQIGTIITTIMGSIDWATLGKNAFQFAVSFILGFVSALLDPVAWLTAIANNWETLLVLIIGLLLAPVSWLGKIGAALAKIPLVGKFLAWIWGGIQKVIAPLSTKIGTFFSTLGKNFMNGWKRVFGEGTVFGDWIAKLGRIWGKIIAWFSTKFTAMGTKFQVWADKAGEILAKPFKWMLDKAGGFIEKVITKVGKIWDKVKDIAGKIKGAVGNMFTGIKTPHFTMSGSMNPLKWKDQGMPKIGVNWYAKGGIFKGTNGGSLIGVGENGGDEAVLPLSNKTRMKPFAEATASMMPEQKGQVVAAGGQYTFSIPITLDGREIARGSATFMQSELDKINKRNRRMGGTV